MLKWSEDIKRTRSRPALSGNEEEASSAACWSMRWPRAVPWDALSPVLVTSPQG
jgi:hypothetical protein